MTTYITNGFPEIALGHKSVRVYGETHKVSHEEMLTMIQEATTTPSSVNIWSWRFVAVENEVGKEKLKPLICFNTRQNETSSAVPLIFDDLNYRERGEEIYSQAYASGKTPKEVRDQQLVAVIPHHESLNGEQMNDIVKVDADLVTMQLVLVVRAYGCETNSISGFEAEKLTKTFSSDQEHYAPVMILSVGKGVETGYEPVRLAPEKVMTFG